MKYFLRSWTDRDAGSDVEISHAIYPEYQEEPHHPAWFPARQLRAPREYSSVTSSCRPTETNLLPMPRYGNFGRDDIVLIWLSARSVKGKALRISSWAK